MSRSILALVMLLVLARGSAQMPSLPPTPTTWKFALSLSSGTDGQLFSLYLVKLGRDSAVLETQPLNRANFVRQVQGRAFSKANPDAEDLFRKFAVRKCTLSEDSVHMGFLTDCNVLDDLWRLKFQRYPLKLAEGIHELLGWAGKPLRPDDRQLMLLSGYGMQHTLDLVIGDQMFRLLKDMCDPDWVANYRSGL